MRRSLLPRDDDRLDGKKNKKILVVACAAAVVLLGLGAWRLLALLEIKRTPTCKDVEQNDAGNVTCYARIHSMITERGLNDTAAKGLVAQQFPQACGPCATAEA